MPYIDPFFLSEWWITHRKNASMRPPYGPHSFRLPPNPLQHCGRLRSKCRLHDGTDDGYLPCTDDTDEAYRCEVQRLIHDVKHNTRYEANSRREAVAVLLQFRALIFNRLHSFIWKPGHVEPSQSHKFNLRCDEVHPEGACIFGNDLDSSIVPDWKQSYTHLLKIVAENVDNILDRDESDGDSPSDPPRDVYMQPYDFLVSTLDLINLWGRTHQNEALSRTPAVLSYMRVRARLFASFEIYNSRAKPRSVFNARGYIVDISESAASMAESLTLYRYPRVKSGPDVNLVIDCDPDGEMAAMDRKGRDKPLLATLTGGGPCSGANAVQLFMALRSFIRRNVGYVLFPVRHPMFLSPYDFLYTIRDFIDLEQNTTDTPGVASGVESQYQEPAVLDSVAFDGDAPDTDDHRGQSVAGREDDSDPAPETAAHPYPRIDRPNAAIDPVNTEEDPPDAADDDEPYERRSVPSRDDFESAYDSYDSYESEAERPDARNHPSVSPVVSADDDDDDIVSVLDVEEDLTGSNADQRQINPRERCVFNAIVYAKRKEAEYAKWLARKHGENCTIKRCAQLAAKKRKTAEGRN